MPDRRRSGLGTGSGIERLKAFPRAPAPNHDPASVKSNLEEGDVALLQNILAYHVAHHPDSKVFGNAQAAGLTLVEAFVRSPGSGQTNERIPVATNGGLDFRGQRPDKLEAVTVCELTVEEGMLNVHRTFAGACAMLVVDIATFSPLFALSAVTGVDASGFSTSMNIVWHAPAVLGTKLRFVATTLSFKGKTASARCEVYDAKRGTLLISATHIIAPVQGLLPVAGPDKPTLSAKL